MRCPHCAHQDYYIDDSGIYAEEKDKFFRLWRTMERVVNRSIEVALVYGCPRCKKTFIDGEK